MRRREFLIAGGAVLWPFLGQAQSSHKRVHVLIAFSEADPVARPRVTAFENTLHAQARLKQLDLEIIYHWGADDVERARLLAKQVVESRPDVIVSHASPATIAVHQETRTIPIIFIQVTDPVSAGIVASLSRPGGNATGFTNFDASLGGKWLGLLKQIFPQMKQVALLYNPPVAPFIGFYLKTLNESAARLAVEAVPSPVERATELEQVLDKIGRTPSMGLIVAPDLFTANNRKTIISAAESHRLPAIYPFRYFAVDGGLVSYGIDPIHPFQQAGLYTDRVLRGEHPADLPVQQPTKFELVVNMRTAKIFGVDMPSTLLALADEVIE